MSDAPLVWIDCEMTGLDLEADALIEVACIVTDAELNPLGTGVNVVIKPPADAIEAMSEFVTTMHTTSGLITELDDGMTMADAQRAVMDYVKSQIGSNRAPLAGNTVGMDKAFLDRDMPELMELLALPRGRRQFHQGTGAPLVPPGVLQRPRQDGRPPRDGRHRGLDSRASLLPRDRIRAAARPRFGRREGRRGRRHGARSPSERALAANRKAVVCGDSLALVHFSLAVRPMVGVAQLVEHLVVVQAAAGSSPVTHPRRRRPLAHAGGLLA